MKSGNLNVLELSGPLQACNGTALPVPYFYVSTFLRTCTVPCLAVFCTYFDFVLSWYVAEVFFEQF